MLPSKRLVHFFAVVAACLQTAMWIVIVGKAVPDKWLASLRLRKCGWLIDLATLLPFLPMLLYFLILLYGIVFIGLLLLFLPPILVIRAINALVNACLPSLSDSVANLFCCEVLTLRITVATLVTQCR